VPPDVVLAPIIALEKDTTFGEEMPNESTLGLEKICDFHVEEEEALCWEQEEVRFYLPFLSAGITYISRKNSIVSFTSVSGSCAQTSSVARSSRNESRVFKPISQRFVLEKKQMQL